MPGPVSDSSKGPGPDSPYVPSWCYPDNAPKVCPCGPTTEVCKDW